MLTQADASGGLGSFGRELLGEITGGLKLVARGELARRYGFSFGADNTVSVNTQGETKPAGAPGATPTVKDHATQFLRSPLIVAGLVAAAVAIVVAIVRR